MRNALSVMMAVAWALASTPVQAAPWTRADDAQLRSDIEILANAEVIDGITTQWPLPWAGILKRLQGGNALSGQPAHVAAAARRVLDQGKTETGGKGIRAEVRINATNIPSFVRRFDALGRVTAQAQFSAEMLLSPSTTLHLNFGLQSSSTRKPSPQLPGPTLFDHETGYVQSSYFLSDHPDHQTLVFDGTYIAQKIGNSIVYAGYMPHWWGPGWMSSLMMSTNARPFPQIGIARNSTEAFTWPVLRWLGPWQAEFLVGVLDGPASSQNILTNSFRIVVNPLPGLEIGASRTQLFCGMGHPCKPLVNFFQIQHSNTNSDNAASSGQFDFRYSSRIAGIPFSFYNQNMFMDAGRPTPMGVSSLFGASVWIPDGERTLRLTAEFTTSEPTYNLFTFDDIEHGRAYNSPKYLEGYRYRGRSLGFSLDSDSQLLTFQASFNDARNRVYTLSFDHASVSNDCNASGCARPHVYGNAVTTAPVKINMVEGRATFPFRNLKFDFALRIQDDQPRPSHGWTGGVEIALRRQF